MKKRLAAWRKFIYENSLSLVMFGLFGAFLVGLFFTGYAHEQEELRRHGEPPITRLEYVASGEFVEAVSENWESEFLQMGALVVLTIWLRQKGAPDSKKLKGKEPVDTSPRFSIIRSRDWRGRGRALGEKIYDNSLSLALLGLFALSFALHAVGGSAAHNSEAAQHGGEQLSVRQYVMTSQFWFESSQNWQSEFLAIGALLVLSIFLRQRSSPESEPVTDDDSKTGD